MTSFTKPKVHNNNNNNNTVCVQYATCGCGLGFGDSGLGLGLGVCFLGLGVTLVALTSLPGEYTAEVTTFLPQLKTVLYKNMFGNRCLFQYI